MRKNKKFDMIVVALFLALFASIISLSSEDYWACLFFGALGVFLLWLEDV